MKGRLVMRERRTPYDTLPEIPFGTRPKVLFVGNGINLSFSGATKTDSVLRDEWKNSYNEELPERNEDNSSHRIWSVPFPLQVVAATKDHVQGSMTRLSFMFENADVESAQRTFINEILDTGFDAVLSTNYSLEFEKSTIDGYSKHKVYSRYKTTKKQTSQQKQFGIYQCTELNDSNHSLLWHVHGTSLRKNSMVMGQLYYGKLLVEVTKRANEVNSWYRYSLKHHSSFVPKSWIDYFLIGDVHIFGFKLDFSEIDIWWLLSYKKSAFPQSKTFFYDSSIDDEKRILLKCYEVELPTIAFDESKENRYIDYYKKICASI